MSIKEQLKKDLTEAIRGRDEITSGTIRMVLTAITNEEVAGKEARVLSDEEVITVPVSYTHLKNSRCAMNLARFLECLS